MVKKTIEVSVCHDKENVENHCPRILLLCVVRRVAVIDILLLYLVYINEGFLFAARWFVQLTLKWV